ncbi:hypothetical protein NW767_010247 [Fusarium falciforme]|nr:hypothetical protein NW767_010247 [Fusarium falciforme]
MLCHAAGEQGDDDASDENQHTPNGLMGGLSNGPGATPSAYSTQTPHAPSHLRPDPGAPSEVTINDYPLVKDRAIDPILLVQLLRQ